MIAQDDDLIRRAYELLSEFAESTRQYREKCRMNERYWRSDHWYGVARREAGEPQPVTPVMFSTLESVLADLMDHYPDAVVLGEDPSDDRVAETLTQLVRYVLKRRHYRQTFRSKTRSVLMKGAAVQEVFWDPTLAGGLGDVNVREWSIDDFYWDPKFADMQEGRAVFKVAWYPQEWFAERYPQQAGWIVGGDTRLREEERAFLDVRDENNIALIEYWFREYAPESDEYRVHMCRLAGGVLLEDSRMHSPGGMYAHGMYPFLVEALYPLAGQPVGIGFVDVLRNLQDYADSLDQIILKNAALSGKLKLLVNRAADLDEESLTDMDAEVVRGSRIDEGAVRWMQAAPMNSYILTYQQLKLSQIKEESGQNQFNRGESGGGVTAASAILALQEAGSKRSRVLIDQMYDGFERLVRMLIDVIREYYTEERVFRVRGEKDMLAALEGDGVPLEFDVRIQVQKQTAYSTLYQNELALQLLSAGVIGREDALDMMAFEGRDRILQAAKQRAEQGMDGLAPTEQALSR